MSLPEYTSLNEKNIYFQTGSCVIDRPVDFDKIIPVLKHFSENKYVFRGVNEAKYKLFNSGQRKFIQLGLESKFASYKEFIYSEMDQFKLENTNWKNEYVYAGINSDNHLALLSLMQHRNYPSPCIDFTTNPLVSLYFAFKFSESKKETITVLDNYVSIYFMCKDHFLIPFHNFGDSIREGLLSRNILKGENHNLSLNNYKAFEALFLADGPMLFDITLDIEYAVLNNNNILIQNGLLILNPNGTNSLEETAQYIIRSYIGKPWLPIKCFNFNKSLKEHVIQFLDFNEINERTIELT
jgi:hypothetical protein